VRNVSLILVGVNAKKDVECVTFMAVGNYVLVAADIMPRAALSVVLEVSSVNTSIELTTV
jgi:hypothetical protein